MVHSPFEKGRARQPNDPFYAKRTHTPRLRRTDRNMRFFRLGLFSDSFILEFITESGVAPSMIADFSGKAGGQYFDGVSAAIKFDDLFDYSIGGSLSYQVDADGILKYAPHNLNLRSETLNNGWTVERVSVEADAIIAPDGTITADKIVEDGVTGVHRIYIDNSINLTGVGQQYSVYLKAAERNWFFLSAFADAGNGVYFDVTPGAGVVGSVSTDFSGTIEDVGDGWFLCSITNSNSSTSTAFVRIGLADSDGGRSYAGDTVSGAYAWGGQVNNTPMAAASGTYAANYVPTTDSFVYQHRLDHDKDGNRRGLLIEEARTNQSRHSENFSDVSWNKVAVNISEDATIAPDGETTADKFVEDNTAATTHRVWAQVGPTLTVAAWTWSCFLKAAERNWLKLRLDVGGSFDGAYFDLSGSGAIGIVDSGYTARIEDYGNGWFRCSVSLTATVDSYTLSVHLAESDGVDVYDGDGSSGAFVWGGQEELGAFTSSYMPVTTIDVTRLAESVDGAISAFAYNNEGANSVIMDISDMGGDGDNSITYLQVHDGTVAEEVVIRRGGAANLVFIIDDNGAGQHFSTLNTGWVAYAATELAFAYELDNINEVQDGVASVASLSGSMPNVITISIGWQGTNTRRRINGHINSVAFYGERISDADMVAGTTL